MRMILAALLLLPMLAGCQTAAVAPLLAAEAVSVMVLGRGIGDIAVSAISGQDCSIVRLDRGQTYCAPRNPPIRTAYCTRSLGVPDCWAAPPLQPPLADAPPATEGQIRYREARWPKAITSSIP